MDDENEQAIIESWKVNALPWIDAIENNEIRSRVECTNQAIVNTVLTLKPRRVIDIGCGEGWLCRSLQAHCIDTLGIDASEALIKQAKLKGSDRGDYLICDYDRLDSVVEGDRFDLAVCNFSLLGNETVTRLFQQIPNILTPTGWLVIQTLHPNYSSDYPLAGDAWQPGSWDGFNDRFSNPAPWYRRTLESWFDLFSGNNFTIDYCYEPVNEVTGLPASIIIVGRLSNSS